MQFLRQSTAATIVLGQFVDSTTGSDAETALTISQADIRLSKNGGAFAQTNNATGATHMENGFYSVPLDTTDTNTVGRLTVAVHESGALSVWREYQVLEETVYDALIGASAAGELAVKLSTQGKADVNAEADTAISDASLATAAALATVDGNVDSILADTGTDGVVVAAGSKTGYSLTATTGLGNQTADITGSLSGSVGSVTGNVGGNVTGNIGSLATQAKADVNAEADTAISDAALATAAALATVDNEIAVIDGIVDDLKSGIIYGAAATGTLSSTQATTNLTGYANDQLIGRVVIWLSGNAEGEASAITDYASTGGLLTFDALTTAPGNGDLLKIV